MVADMLEAARKAGEVLPPPEGSQESVPNPEEILVTPEPAQQVEVPRINRPEAVQMIAQPQYEAPRAPLVYEVKSEIKQEIEKILADKELMEIYKHLDPKDQKVMKMNGEKLLNDISADISKGKLSSHKTLVGIKKFLKAPKISHWYLLQKGKIVHDTVLNKAEKLAKIV